MEALYAVARGLIVEIFVVLAGCTGVLTVFEGGVKTEDIEDAELLSKLSITLLKRGLK